MKKWIAYLLLVIMALNLGACGKRPEANHAAPNNNSGQGLPTSTLETSYVLTDHTPLPSEINHVSAFHIRDGAAFLCCQERSDRTRIDDSYLARMGLDGSGFEKIVLPLPQGTTLLDMTIDNAGNFWILGRECDTDYTLYVLDAALSVKRSFSLNEYTQDAEALAYGSFHLGADNSGHVCLALSYVEMACFVFDENELSFRLQHSSHPVNVLTTAEGELAFAATPDGGASCELLYIDMVGKVWGQTLPLTVAQAVYGGRGDDNFYVFDSAALYSHKTNGESTPVFSWSELGLSAGDSSFLCPLEDGSFAVLTSTFSPSGLGVYDYCRVVMGVDDRVTLSMVSMQPDSSMLEAVAQFNKTNTEYKIRMESYFSFYANVSDSEWDNALTRFNTELIAGNVPDIIDLSYLPVETYLRQGILEDLRPYIQNDNVIRESDFFENVFDAFSINGQLPFVTNSVYIQTIASDSRVTGTQGGWSYDAFYRFLIEQGESSMGRVRHNTFLSFMLRSSNRFVNWTDSTADLNNPEFIQLLNLAKDLEGRRDIFFDAYGMGLYLDDFSPAYQASTLATINSLHSMAQYRTAFEGNLNMIGYPNEDGVCHVLAPKCKIGVSALSSHKDGAWQFARSFLEQHQQEASFFLPISKAAFDKMMTDSLNGNSMWKDAFWGEVLPEDAERLRALMSSAKYAWTGDTALVDVICEATEPFFLGEKSAEAVAADAQNSASLYLNERR